MIYNSRTDINYLFELKETVQTSLEFNDDKTLKIK